MAPYKLEDNIREKLEARELKPSADAWKKLEAKLDGQQPKKKTVLWYYVAASFVGLLILASVFFNNNDPEANNQIVNETTEQNNTISKPEIITNNSIVEEIATEENISEKGEAIKSKERTKQKANPITPKRLPLKKSEIDKKIESEVIAQVSKEKKQQSVKDEAPIISEVSSEVLVKGEKDKLLNNKVDEVVASVKKLQEDNTEVTAAEVEALLTNAHRDIQSQRILNTPKVDAAALLQDVEWELEKSFRDKVFDALGEGFQKVRTAVSERND